MGASGIELSTFLSCINNIVLSDGTCLEEDCTIAEYVIANVYHAR